MVSVLYALSIVLFVIVYILRTIHYTHMFQQNSYKSVHQLKWFFKKIGAYALNTLPIIVCLLVPVFVNDALAVAVASVVLLLISVFLNLPIKAKKPLVYTRRVIRLLITDSLFLVAATVLSAILFFETKVSVYIMTAALIAAPFIVLLANMINKPLESAINMYFINDAKKKIKDHHSLITIGVTGSYGKTSVKYMLKTLLEAKYNVLITPESYNTTLGVTRVIRESLRATQDIFVCEMGAKHVGDIKEICDIVHPACGVITSIGPQHLETFKTLDNVKKTKYELADSLPSDGKLFLNADDENVLSYNSNPNAVLYGLNPDCHYYASDICATSDGTRFIAHHNGEEVEFNTSLIGRHNVTNIMGAIAVACEMGISLDRLPPYVKKLKAVDHRLQLTKRGNTIVIDDAYNSNPSGVRAALNALSLFDGYKVIITPGMVELGKVQDEENFKFGTLIASVCDYVVLVGKKQTESIYNGLIKSGYDESKIFVADNLNEGADRAFGLSTDKKHKIVLFENDLPDNY